MRNCYAATCLRPPPPSRKDESSLRLNHRIVTLPPQFFADLVARAQSRREAGRPLVDLGRGSPDLPTPRRIVQRLVEEAMHPQNHGYSPFRGLRPLREAVAERYAREFGVTVDPDRQVAVLFGSKAGLVHLFQVLLEPGESCLLPDPGYPDYLSGVHLSGARLLLYRLAPPSWRPDVSAWPEARLVYLNHPHNPTTAIADDRLLDEAVAYAHRSGALLAYDAAYQDLVFEDRPRSILERPGAMDVAVEFTTLSKSYNMAGWRVGFAVGQAEAIAGLSVLQDHLYTSLFPAIQWAAVEALSGPQDDLRELVAVYRRRRDLLVAGLRRRGWEVSPSPGTFYLWQKVPGGEDSFSFADRMLNERDVVVAPGAGFGPGGEGYMRLSLAVADADLEEAIRRFPDWT